MNLQNKAQSAFSASLAVILGYFWTTTPALQFLLRSGDNTHLAALAEKLGLLERRRVPRIGTLNQHGEDLLAPRTAEPERLPQEMGCSRSPPSGKAAQITQIFVHDSKPVVDPVYIEEEAGKPRLHQGVRQAP